MLPTLLIAAAAAAALATLSRVTGRRRLHLLTKPLATALLLALALVAPAGTARYGLWIGAGLALSLAGDVFLLFPTRFLAGLVAFLLAHLAYLAALLPGAQLTPWVVLVAPLGVLVYLRVAPHRGRLRLPVALYTAVILSVVAVAGLRTLAPGEAGAWLAAGGILLFAVSDTLLAYQRFRRELPWGHGWVLSSYYLGQGLIALSVWWRAGP